MDIEALPIEGGFDFRPRTRLVYGPGVLKHLGGIARELGARRVLVISDPGIAAAGHLARAGELLAAAELEHELWAESQEDPTELDVARCAEHARAFAPDLFVGLGGGSSIDTAKGANFVLTNGGRMRDYHGHGKARSGMLPLIAVPTTAGTGSEVQSFALVGHEEGHKMACGDPKAAPRVALLDPELTASVPRPVVAATGLDAIGHAVEAAVTKAGNAISSLYAREAFRLADASFERVLEPDSSLEVRGDMLRAAAFAGLAIEASMLGAAHSMANPLSAGFGLSHGLAVAMALPHVVRFNAHDPGAALGYRELAAQAGLCARDADPRAAAERLADRLDELRTAAGYPAGLTALGITEAALDGLAAGAAQQWTAGFNPRAVSERDFRELYRGAL